MACFGKKDITKKYKEVLGKGSISIKSAIYTY